MQLQMVGQHSFILILHENGPQRTMLIEGGLHEPCLAGSLVKVGEELCLLVMMMLMDAVVPGYAVAREVQLVRVWNAWGLLVDAVETTDEGVMTQGHVRGLNRERVCLKDFVRTISLKQVKAAYLARLKLWSRYHRQRRVRVHRTRGVSHGGEMEIDLSAFQARNGKECRFNVMKREE